MSKSECERSLCHQDDDSEGESDSLSKSLLRLMESQHATASCEVEDAER